MLKYQTTEFVDFRAPLRRHQRGRFVLLNDGRSIQALGVSPDIVVAQPPARVEEEAEDTPRRRPRSEADLRGSLNHDSLTEDEIKQIEEDRAKAEKAAELREEDYQLAYAIDILKGLTALQPSKERSYRAARRNPCRV